MLTSNVFNHIGHAQQYYPHLNQDDFNYYLDQYKAHYQGKLSQRIGFNGIEATESNFSSFLHGIIPGTDTKMRVRDVEGARVGVDLCANVPKSVSIAYAVTQDQAILDAIEYGNTQMMRRVEKYAQYQANTQTQRNYIYSRELLWSSWLHRTTRPVKIDMPNSETVVAPEMHLHFHNFINTHTWNEAQQRFQALEIGEIFRRLPNFEKDFHSFVSYKLREAGYQISRSENGFYELSGISRSVVQRFSNRTRDINRFAKEKNITDPKTKGEIGPKLRLSKRDSTVEEKDLPEHWASRFTQQELQTIRTLKGKEFKGPKPLSAKECLDRAIAHHLEREAAAPTERVIATALTYGYGHILPHDVQKAISEKKDVLQHEMEGMSYMTTLEMLQAENRLIQLATNGKGKYHALNPDYKPQYDWINAQQRNAIKTLLSTDDRTIILRGSAGVGKTTLLKEVHRGVNQAQKSLIAAAPSSQAVKVLEKEAFDAYTVAAILHNSELQSKLQNQVLLVDEAGQCGLKDMSELLALAEKYNTRTILSGDTRQHSPVQQEALRLLETQSQVQTVTVNKIMRQKPKDYKAAIQKLAVGRTLEGYQDLDKKMGAIKEEPDNEKRIDQMTDHYVNSISKGRSAIIISPTNFESDIINNVVREKLKARGDIKGKEKVFDRLINLSLTQTQKKDPINYASEGLVVRFSKNQKGGLYAGTHHEIIPLKDNQDDLSIKDLKSGEIRKLSLENTKHFDVFQKSKISLAQGDLIQLTQNSKSLQGSKLNNGNTYHIKSFVKNGVQLDNGKTIPNDHFHWKYSHASTSHSAQGKTKDDVFISMLDMSFAAVNEQTLYVSASRGKHSANIYTSSKEELKRAVARSGVQVTAREVAEGHELRMLQQKQRAHHQRLNDQIKNHGRIEKRDKQIDRKVERELPRDRS